MGNTQKLAQESEKNNFSIDQKSIRPSTHSSKYSSLNSRNSSNVTSLQPSRSHTPRTHLLKKQQQKTMKRDVLTHSNSKITLLSKDHRVQSKSSIKKIAESSQLLNVSHNIAATNELKPQIGLSQNQQCKGSSKIRLSLKSHKFSNKENEQHGSQCKRSKNRLISSSSLNYLNRTSKKSGSKIDQIVCSHQKGSRGLCEKKNVQNKASLKINSNQSKPDTENTAPRKECLNSTLNSTDENHMNPINGKKTVRNGRTKICLKQLRRSDNRVEEAGVQRTAELENMSNISSIASQQNTLSSIGNVLNEEWVLTDASELEETIEDQQILENHHNPPQLYRSCGDFVEPMQKKVCHYFIQEAESILHENENYGRVVPEFLRRYQLPQKNLLALTDIILRQKDMILEESFEHSQLNSCRQSNNLEPQNSKTDSGKLLRDQMMTQK